MIKYKWQYRFALLACLIFLSLLLLPSLLNHQQTKNHQETAVSSISVNGAQEEVNQPKQVVSRKQEVVDVIGGSMAFGWKDPNNVSYLQRAFAIRSKETSVQYNYINHAIPGFTAQWLNYKYPGRYEEWLTTDHPQIVVLSWGLENDMSSDHKDSLKEFADQIKGEISKALNQHAVVLIITPPVTKLLATEDRNKVESYIQTEFNVGQSFHSQNVVTINLFNHFKTYMKDHHESYKPYYGNAWHPNRAGHVLGGQLLAKQLEDKFGNGPILFKGNVSSTSTQLKQL